MKIAKPILHTNYELVLRNTKTNKITQKAKALNTMCIGFFTGADFTGPIVECGSGDKAPTYNDTQLTKPLFYCLSSFSWKPVEIIDEQTLKYIGTFIAPADSSHVGEVKEVGIYLNNLASHALLKDAEGNPISITKTDIDELTVTVTAYIKAATGENYRYLITSEASKFLNSYQNRLVPFWKTTYCNGLAIAASVARSNKYKKRYTHDAINFFYEYYNTANPKGQCRIGTEVSNGFYLNSIDVKFNSDYGGSSDYSPLLEIPFPNTLLPAYTVQGISIGTGNGETKEFEPPIPMWVKDTDKVYVNGVLQTRDVDYTIDHKANRSRDRFIANSNFVKEYKNTKPITDWPTRYSFTTDVPYTEMISAKKGPVIKKGNPLILEYEEDACMGLDVNCWVPGQWLMVDTTGWNNSGTKGLIIKLEVSTDGENFTEVASYTYDSSTISTPIMFEKAKMKFARLSCENMAEGYTLYKQYSQGNPVGYIGYYGEPIKFTNPPAVDAEITMDVQFDRPYKNKNFVLDFALEFDFR